MSTTLASEGIGASDRVVVLLPEGPELAACLFALGTVAWALPLGEEIGDEGVHARVATLGPRAVIASKDRLEPGRQCAEAWGVPLWTLHPKGAPSAAGSYDLRRASWTGGRSSSRAPEDRRCAAPRGPGWLMMTSGTTGPARVVHLPQGPIAESCAAVAEALELAREDRCLILPPLRTALGWIGGCLATWWSGGACHVGSSGVPSIPDFVNAGHRLSWAVGTPAMLQHWRRIVEPFEGWDRAGLRFLQSSGAPLPTRWRTELETAFGVPVLEAYGVTEVAHHVCTQRPPPHSRRPGAVGKPGPGRVQVVNPEGHRSSPETPGEILVRVSCPPPGAEPSHAAASVDSRGSEVDAETDEWLATGDLGYLDETGDLHVVGRGAEAIVRGGRRIFPRPIEDHLLHHSSVRAAVVFPIPDRHLGQEVAAAVTLRPGHAPTEEDLRNHVFEAGQSLHVPVRILILPELPRQPDGRLRRRDLAGQLAACFAPVVEPPAEGTEQLVARVFGEVLGRPNVGRREHFLVLGGDSLGAVRVAALLAREYDLPLSRAVVFRHPTVAQLAAELDRLAGDRELDLLADELGRLSREERDRLLG